MIFNFLIQIEEKKKTLRVSSFGECPCRYCGWSPHQLEQEVKKGYWWVVSASNDILQMHEHAQGAQGAHASSLWSYLYHLLKFAPHDNQ